MFPNEQQRYLHCHSLSHLSLISLKKSICPHGEATRFLVHLLMWYQQKMVPHADFCLFMWIDHFHELHVRLCRIFTL
jgi:hypothetical protein